MPFRIIKDTIRTSRNVNSLTDFQFRVWVHLITYVDDYGRGSADAELLKGLLFPRRAGVTLRQINDAIGALASKGMISLYEFDGEPYFYFPKWGEHQRIRTKVSKFPEPAASGGESPQMAADGGESPQMAARNQNQNQKPIKKPEPEYTARAPAHTREEDAGDAVFNAFWASYPRKSGEIKGAYMEFLHALDTGATPDEIMAALKWQADEWQREGEPRYIPSPQKWLENRRWEEQRREAGTGKKAGKAGMPLTAEQYAAQTPKPVDMAALKKAVDLI